MSKSNKIRSLLALKGIKSVEYSKQLGLSRPQALNTKYYRDAFTSDDLIQLADLTGTRLAFIDPITREPLIMFEYEDAKEKDENAAAKKKSKRAMSQDDSRDLDNVAVTLKV